MMALYGTYCGDLVILCSMYSLNVSRIVFNVNYVYITLEYTRFTINKYLGHFQYKLTNRRSWVGQEDAKRLNSLGNKIFLQTY